MAAPIRVGILHDMSESPPDEPTLGGGVDGFLRRAIDDLLQRGRLDRDVEIVQAAGMGCRPARPLRSNAPSASSSRRACS